MSLRLLIAALLLAIALPVFAQTDGKVPVLQPLPEPPPPPPGYEPDPALEPQVTILKRGEDTVEEFRINGQLYMVKVTPPHGTPYYLIDRLGDGVFHRQDSLSTDIRPPMWVLFTF
jgi:hypothetical protein